MEELMAQCLHQSLQVRTTPARGTQEVTCHCTHVVCQAGAHSVCATCARSACHATGKPRECLMHCRLFGADEPACTSVLAHCP